MTVSDLNHVSSFHLLLVSVRVIVNAWRDSLWSRQSLCSGHLVSQRLSVLQLVLLCWCGHHPSLAWALPCFLHGSVPFFSFYTLPVPQQRCVCVWCLSVCLSLCMCVGICVCLGMYVHACGALPQSLLAFVWDKVSHQPETSLHRAGWMAGKLLGSACFCLWPWFCWTYKVMLSHSSYMGSVNLNSRSHTWVANTVWMTHFPRYTVFF